MKLRIFGIPTETGVGVHSLNIYQALSRLNSDFLAVEWISKYDIPKILDSIETSHEDDVNIFLFRMQNLSGLLKGKKYYWYVFEATKPASSPTELLLEFDYLISPSSWGRECLIDSGADPGRVLIIPEGVDIWQYHPYKKTREKNLKTRFLMIGKYETRKGYKEAFAAFDEAVQRYPNMELWIKPDWINGEDSFYVSELKNEIDKYPKRRITLIRGGILSVYQLRQLYWSADYFLFPSLCEAWGLPLIEAIACGTPAICCDFGGQSEYLKTISGGYIPIPYEIAPVNCEKWKEDYPQPGGGHGDWAKINPSLLAELMISACKIDFSDQAMKSSQIIRSQFSWAQSAQKLADYVLTI